MILTKMLCVTDPEWFLERRAVDPDYDCNIALAHPDGIPDGWVALHLVDVEAEDETLTKEYLMPAMIDALDAQEEKETVAFHQKLHAIHLKRSELLAITCQVDDE